MEAEYLGDAVYIKEWDEMDGVVLTTDSHRDHEAGNKIYLEPFVIRAMLKWLERRDQEKSGKKNENSLESDVRD